MKSIIFFLIVLFAIFTQACRTTTATYDAGYCGQSGYGHEWETQIDKDGNGVIFIPTDENGQNLCPTIALVKDGDGWKMMNLLPDKREPVVYFANTSKVAPFAAVCTQIDGPVSPVADIAAGIAMTVLVMYDGVEAIGYLMVDAVTNTAKVVFQDPVSGIVKTTQFIIESIESVEESVEESVDRAETDDAARRYVLYYKPHKTIPGKYYIGRTSGFEDPFSILANRDANHHRNAEYGPAMLIFSYKGDIGRWIVRGGEQYLIDFLGGPNSLECGNAIRGVAEINPKGYLYYSCYLDATSIDNRIPVAWGKLETQPQIFTGFIKALNGPVILYGFSILDIEEFEMEGY